MPDDNKFEKLREVGYQQPVTCGLCIHGPKTGWGECGKHRYEHQRQSNPDAGRGVSVHASGTCRSHELDESRVGFLGAHQEFLQR